MGYFAINKKVLIAGICLLLAAGCTQEGSEQAITVEQTSYGVLQDGREAELYTLTNENGMQVQITNYGGIVTALYTPDRNGNVENVVLGFESLEKYEGDHPYFGAIIGRYGNRIEDGRFEIDGTEYRLATNDGDNHLHGGELGFDRVLWDAEVTEDHMLKLSYLSEDGEEGYPGNLDVTVVYSLSPDNELGIEYTATTDKPTHVNLTNHSYFNLSGNPENSILSHELQIDAQDYTPVNDELIPTGEIMPVENTPFDFTDPFEIGARIEQVEGGYDHNFVLGMEPADTLRRAAVLYSPESGREMSVWTTEPGLQFYSGNFLDGSLEGPGGVIYEQYAGLCLETQHLPNTPNENSFPSTLLQPGEEYHTITVYRFSAR